MTGPGNRAYLSRANERALAVVVAVVTANAYYIHPIIREVAQHFGVSDARIGIVPALNQIALAIGILLFLPLGDRIPNRTLTIVFVSGQTAALAVMTLAGTFAVFVIGSTMLGFLTVAPYLLPTYASRRVAPERLGQVTAQLTAGVIIGILVARVGAGVVTTHLGWRAVYWIATGAMVAVTVALPWIMEKRSAAREAPPPYLALMRSLVPLTRQHPEVVLSGAIQALNFASFIALWLGLALHLTSPRMGYGVDTVGYLAGIAAVSAISTPRLGLVADRIGPRHARAIFGVIQLCGVLLLYPLGGSLWTILIPLVMVNLVGPGLDVTGRMTFLTLPPETRTRLTTIYIVLMFVGGGIGSFLGTWAFDRFDWAGTSGLLAAIATRSTTLCLLAWRRYGN